MTDAKPKDQRPWRKVVDTTKLEGRSYYGSNRNLIIYNILECGHRFQVRGEAALTAALVTKRRCRRCTPKEIML